MNGEKRPERADRISPLIDLSVLAACTAFLIYVFKPRYLFLETITTGGDTASHYYTVKYLAEILIPSGRLTGWTMGNYAGFPILLFYFPFSFLLMVVVGALTGLPVAFKLVTALSVLILPPCAWGALRLMRFRFPIPAMGALASLSFLFIGENSMWGGNIPSMLAGEFSYSFGFAFTLLFLGSIYDGIRRERRVLANGILLFFIGFSHGYALLFAGLASLFFMVTIDRWGRKFIYLAKVAGLAFLLLGFWLLPLMANASYTIPYNFKWIMQSTYEVIPPILIPLFALALIVTILDLVQGARGRGFDDRIYFFWFGAAVSAVFYFSASTLGVVDIRFIPFAHCLLALLGAVGVGRLAGRLRGQWIVAILFLIGTFIWVESRVGFIPQWIAWNYEGFEKKGVWKDFSAVNDWLRGRSEEPAYSGLNDELIRLPGEPRVVFEHSSAHNAAGTTRAFESLPLFSGRSTLEGVYMQASLSAPFVFYVQSEISKEHSCPFTQYDCARVDLERGAKHLQMFNVSHAVIISPTIKKLIKDHPSFRQAASFGAYEIYEVMTCDGLYVLPVPLEPVLYTGPDWRNDVYRWFGDFDVNDVVLVNSASVRPEDRSRFKAATEEIADLPRIPVPVAGDCEVSFEIRDEEIFFETTCPGTPHLVRVTYHPKWRAEGAGAIYWASPAFMLVYPEQRRVRLFYARTAADWVGSVFSILGLAILTVGLFRRRPAPGEGDSGPGPGEDLPAGDEDRRSSRLRKTALAIGLIAVGAGVGMLIYRSETRDPNALYQKGIMAKDAKDYDRARGYFGTILERQPTCSMADEAGYYFAICFYLEEDWSRAIESFEHLVEEYPDSVFTPEGLYHIGLCRRNLNEPIRAVELFEQVVDHYPVTQWAGYARERLSELSGVGQRYGRAISFFNQDRCDEASPIFAEIVEKHPDFKGVDQALACYALCFYKKQDYPGTITAYRRLIEKYPESRLVDEAHYHIGQSCKLLGRFDEARTSLEAVVREFPGSRYAGPASAALEESAFDRADKGGL